MAVLSTNLLAVRTELADMIGPCRSASPDLRALLASEHAFLWIYLVDSARVEVQASARLWRLRSPMS